MSALHPDPASAAWRREAQDAIRAADVEAQVTWAKAQLPSSNGHPVRMEHGWMTEAGYLCEGCAVRAGHEHRCHRADAGPACECSVCRDEPGGSVW